MTHEEAIKVLECMAVDLTGCLGGLSKKNPLEDVCRQRLEAINTVLSVLNPVSQEQVEKMRGYWIHEKIQSNQSITGYFELPCCECSNCGCYIQQETNFCPYCGDPKTDEAVQIVIERLEALNENRD